MSISGECIKLDGDLLHVLRGIGERLDGAEGEIVLDFSTVERLAPNEVRAMEELAGVAEGLKVRVVLSGVSVSIYKVLKLAKLASRFTFAN